MSIRQMALVWTKELSRTDKFILLALADHADDTGASVRPSIDLVAWKTGYSSRHIKRRLADYRSSGILTVLRKAGQHRPTEYKLNLDKIPNQAPFIPKSRRDKMSPQAGAWDDPSSDIDDTSSDIQAPGVTPESPDSSLKPSSPTDNDLTGSIKETPPEFPKESEQWEKVLFQIGMQHYRLEHSTFIRRWNGTSLIGADNGTWTIECKNLEQAAWLANHGKLTAERIIPGIAGHKIELEFYHPDQDEIGQDDPTGY